MSMKSNSISIACLVVIVTPKIYATEHTGLNWCLNIFKKLSNKENIGVEPQIPWWIEGRKLLCKTNRWVLWWKYLAIYKTHNSNMFFFWFVSQELKRFYQTWNLGFLALLVQALPTLVSSRNVSKYQKKDLTGKLAWFNPNPQHLCFCQVPNQKLQSHWWQAKLKHTRKCSDLDTSSLRYNLIWWLLTWYGSRLSSENTSDTRTGCWLDRPEKEHEISTKQESRQKTKNNTCQVSNQ